MTDKKLTGKQEAYCQNRAAGMPQTEAYNAAYDRSNGTQKSRYEQASRLEANSKIASRIAKLRRQTEEQAILDREAITALLSSIALDDSRSDGIRLKATEQLNRMQGSYTERHDVTLQGLTRDDRRQEMRQTMESLRQAWTENTECH